jgi:hypothetical protein
MRFFGGFGNVGYWNSAMILGSLIYECILLYFAHHWFDCEVPVSNIFFIWLDCVVPVSNSFFV